MIVEPYSRRHSQTRSRKPRGRCPLCEALLGELALDLVLRGDSGVVRPDHPKRVVALELVVADEDVLDSVIESVAHVERPGDVGRRDGDQRGWTACVVS